MNSLFEHLFRIKERERSNVSFNRSLLYNEDYKDIKLSGFDRSTVYLIILLNISITIFLSWKLNVWIDEVFTLQAVNQDMIHTIQRAFYFEKQPPFYYILLNLWYRLNGTVLFARLLSVVAIALSVFIASKIATRLFNQIPPFIITACIAINPLIIYAAVEIRLFAVAILISSLLLFFFIEGYLSGSKNKIYRVFYILFGIIGLYTQYFLGFLLFANGICLLSLKRWRSLNYYIKDMIVVAFFFSPMLLILPKQLAMHAETTSIKSAGVSFIVGIKTIYRIIVDYLYPLSWQYKENVLWVTVRIWAFRLSALLIAVDLAKKRPKIFGTKTFGLIVIFSTIILLFLLLRNIIGLGFMKERHLNVLFVPSILVLFSIFATIKDKKILYAVVSLMIFFSSVHFLSYYRYMAKPGDSKNVSAFITKYEKPNEPILFFRNEGLLTFKYYYRGTNDLVPLPLPSIWKTMT